MLCASDEGDDAVYEAQFNVLGPLEVRGGPGLSGKPAMLLAFLLLHANTWVSTEQIVDALWGEDAPASASRNVKTYIWQLRNSLPPADGNERLVGRRGGYRINVAHDEVDISLIERLIAEGGDIDELSAALQLWRGAPYQELPVELTRIATAAAEQLRWELRERLAAALVDAGRNLDAITLVQRLIAEDPLREELWVRLMLALRGAGRRSEALAAYQRARRLLLDELGVEPGPQLQEAQRQVLTGAGRTGGRCFLPRDIPDFVGRTAELERLTAGRGPRVAVIAGMPGCGKTALALHVAHRLSEEYPDGQLFCDLRGHDSVAGPADPADLLAGLLRAFDADVPETLAERAARWRSVLPGRRVLIVLDDAASTAQLSPLLPGAGEFLVLVTSRRQLAELDGAQTVALPPLPVPDALALFTAAAGEERIRAEHTAALTTIRACGNLPLAIRIAAARLRQRPVWTVAMLAQRLQDEETRLTELRTEERDLATVFATSYRQLNSAAQRVFRLLGSSPSQEFDISTVMTLTRMSDVEPIVEELLDRNLLVQERPARYRMHSLLRAYAGQLPVPQVPVRHRRRVGPAVVRTA